MRSITRCPVCGGDLLVRVLECESCGTRIEGKFESSPFDRLDGEQTAFLLEFLKSEGNFSELARKMGLSFPTVKARFQAILKTLGIRAEGTRKVEVSEILNMLERGEITVNDAERLLRGS